MLDGKHFSGAGKSGLHFVGDEQDAVLIENFLDLFEIIRRRNNDSALAHNRFRDERRHIACGSETDHVIDSFGALASAFFWIVSPLRSIRVRSRSKAHACRIWTTTFFTAHVTSDA